MTDSSSGSAPEDALDGPYEPSPIPRIRDQVALYEATDGREGGTLEDHPVVIVTSIGAKSGKVRKNPVIRVTLGDSYIAVASAAGASTNPSWYTNLVTHPFARVQDGAVVRTFRAREVSGDEKQRLWLVAESVWPYYPEYRERAAGRDIPIVLLEPLTE